MLEAGGHKVLVGGNIGHALSAQVEASTAETIHVVEASSFQLEGIETFHPWIAVLLNFSPDHLDRHATVDEYAAAKARIFENQSAADWAVLNADDPASLAIARDAHARRLMLSMTEQLADGIVLDEHAIVSRQEGSVGAAGAAHVHPAARPSPARRRDGRFCGGAHRRGAAGGDDRGGRRIHRARARARAGDATSPACSS